MAQVRFYRGTSEQFNALQDVDPDGFYFISDADQNQEQEE